MKAADFGIDLEEAIASVFRKHFGEDFITGDWTLHDRGHYLELDLSGKSCMKVTRSTDAPKPTVMEKVYHEGHTVVDNFAGGKAFRYCRDCKEEVQ